MFEPALLLLTTMVVDIERRVGDRLGITLQAGVGSSVWVTSGDRMAHYLRGDTVSNLHKVQFTRLQAGMQTNFYLLEPMRGPHVGIELGYKHFNSGAEERSDISVLTSSIYVGWKWITKGSVTWAFQLGGSVVARQDEEYMPGWQRYDEGTLGAVHVFLNFAIGWSK